MKAQQQDRQRPRGDPVRGPRDAQADITRLIAQAQQVARHHAAAGQEDESGWMQELFFGFVKAGPESHGIGDRPDA